MIQLVVLLTLCGAVFSCPEVEPLKSFDIKEYAKGQWYEIARYAHKIEIDADCVIYDFDADGVRADIKEIVKNQAKVVKSSIVPTDEAGKIMFVLPPPTSVNITANVMATDNKSYVVFYYCTLKGTENQPAEVAWIVSRTPTVDDQLKAVLHKEIDEIQVLNNNQLIWDHLSAEDCKH